MPHIVEQARSGRAKCRKCKKTIAKGELRFGEETPNAFAEGAMTYRWYHLGCAAAARPLELETALDGYRGEIPARADLDAALAAGKKKQKPKTFPYAELAPSGRSACLRCRQKIAKGELRVAVQREIDTGSFVSAGAGYLHPRCACAHTEQTADALFAQIEANAPNLAPDQLHALGEQLREYVQRA